MKNVKFKIEKRFVEMMAAGIKTAEVRNELKNLNEGDTVQLVDAENGAQLATYTAGTIYDVARLGHGFGMRKFKRTNAVLSESILNGIGVNYAELKKYCPNDFYKIEIRKFKRG